MSTTAANKPFRVGSWHVEPELNRVRLGERSVQLEPKVMQVLQVMARNAGDLTERRALVEEVWSNAFLGEDPSTRAISELRKAFGDDPRAPSYIETIHGKGYRLIAQVGAIRDQPAKPGGAAGSTSRHWRVLTAVALLGILLVWLGRLSNQSEPAATVLSLRPIPLTTYPGRELQPAISPDGTRVAFAWAGAENRQLDIYVKQRNTEQPLKLTVSDAPELMPLWSPDGTEVAFLRGETDALCAVFAVPAIGGPERPLYTCGQGFNGYDFSPEGDRLVVADIHDGDRTTSLHLIDLRDGTRTRLTHPAGSQWRDTAPLFSPDGRHVAFRRKLGEARYEMFAIDVARGEEWQITHDGEDNGGFAWSPAGDALVVSSNRGGRFALWMVSVASGDATPLGLEDAFLPSVSRSTGTLAYEKRSDSLDVRRAPNPHQQENGEVEVWTESTWDDLDPQYSLDGSQVAFVSTRSGSFELWVADADGAMPRQLTSFGKPMPGWSPAVQHPRWSPDGQRLVFSARAEDDFDVFTIEATGGVPRPITASVGDDLSPVWISGGGWIYFTTNRNGSWELWRSHAYGRPEPVAIDLQVASLDSRGEDIVYLSTLGGTLNRYLHSTGALLRINETISDFTWGLAPQAIYWAMNGQLIRFDTVLGTTSSMPFPGGQTHAGGRHVAASSLSVSPDEAWILWSGVHHDESDLMLIEGLF